MHSYTPQRPKGSHDHHMRRWVDGDKVYSQDILLLKSYKLQVMGITSYGNYKLWELQFTGNYKLLSHKI